MSTQPDTLTVECWTNDHQRCGGYTSDGELCECGHHDDDARAYQEQS